MSTVYRRLKWQKSAILHNRKESPSRNSRYFRGRVFLLHGYKARNRMYKDEPSKEPTYFKGKEQQAVGVAEIEKWEKEIQEGLRALTDGILPPFQVVLIYKLW